MSEFGIALPLRADMRKAKAPVSADGRLRYEMALTLTPWTSSRPQSQRTPRAGGVLLCLSRVAAYC